MSTAYDRINDSYPMPTVAGSADIRLASNTPFVPVIRALYAKGYSSADFERGGVLRTKTLEQLREVLAEPVRKRA